MWRLEDFVPSEISDEHIARPVCRHARVIGGYSARNYDLTTATRASRGQLQHFVGRNIGYEQITGTIHGQAGRAGQPVHYGDGSPVTTAIPRQFDNSAGCSARVIIVCDVEIAGHIQGQPCREVLTRRRQSKLRTECGAVPWYFYNPVVVVVCDENVAIC